MPVYIIQPGDYPVVKIGSSADPNKRAAYFRSHHWADFKILRVLPGSHKEERWLQRYFRHRLIRSEWFHFDHEMLRIEIPEMPAARRRRITDERLAAISPLLDGSKTVEEIAAITGIGKASVYSCVHHLGKRARPGHRRAIARREAALAGKAQGRSLAAIARDLGVSRERVRQYIAYSEAA